MAENPPARSRRESRLPEHVRAHARKLAAEAPPLSPEQAAVLRAIFAGAPKPKPKTVDKAA